MMMLTAAPTMERTIVVVSLMLFLTISCKRMLRGDPVASVYVARTAKLAPVLLPDSADGNGSVCWLACVSRPRRCS